MALNRLLVAALLTASLVGCNRIPSDPEGTLDRVRGGTMRVGISVSDPWATRDGAGFGGVEVELIERFADHLGAEVEYFDGSEEELFAALLHHELDVVIGGLTSQNPHAAEAGMTHPYFTTALVVGWPEDDDMPDDIAGVDTAQEDPLPMRIQTELEKLAWVKEARVRLREEGHVYFGEAFVIPSDERRITQHLTDAARLMKRLDWRLHDLVIAPVEVFEHERPGEGGTGGEIAPGEGGKTA